MRTVYAVLGALALLMGSAGAEIIMDADTRNGSFTNGFVYNTFWNTDPPTGWSVVDNGAPAYRFYNFAANGGATTAIRGQYFDNALAAYNTGLPVDRTQAYKITADLGASTNMLANVWVYATENTDGTGNAVELTHVSYLGQYDNYGQVQFLTTVTATGTPPPSAASGYYVQVRFGTTILEEPPIPDGYYANLVVETLPVPIEFATVALQDALAMEVPTSTGRVYELEYTTDLVQSSLWHSAGMQVIGTGANMYLFDPTESTGTSTSKAYRILAP